MKAIDQMLRAFAEAHPESVARQLEGSARGGAAKILEGLPAGSAVRVLAHLNPSVASGLVDVMDSSRALEVLRSAPRGTTSAILLQMPPERREALLQGLPEAESRRLKDQMLYAPDTAGGMMVPDVLSFSIDLTVQEVISALRKAPPERVHYLYVTDREGKLVGVLGMRELLLAGPREPIRTLVHPEIVSLPVFLDREKVAEVMDRRRFASLPVVDAAGRLLGVVRQEAVTQAVQEEAFEDLQKMAGAGGDERALSPVSSVVRKRFPWLGLNLGTAFAGAIVVGLFEGVIAQVTALAILMPVVSAVSGNTGMQALSVIMRGLALREIAPGNARRVVLKEILAGVLNGLGISILAGGVAWAWFGRPGLALVIALAMTLSMVAAAMLGAAIPLVLKALGRDPAQSSSIFLTTLTDIVGFGSFLGLGGLFMRHLGAG